ncbi:MAG: response regulator [Cyclobacteriaceae bacterium]
MQQIKILVVEDEWVVSEEVKEILEKNNFEVVGQAADAQTALEIAEEFKPDIALLDINIKGDKDGIELAALLQNSCDPGIIFLTAYDDQKYLDRAKSVNPQAYIVKPFREKNIVIAIELAFHNLSKNDAEEVGEDDHKYYVLNDRVFIKDNHRFFKLELSRIKYVEAEGSYCHIHTDKGRHTLAINLKHFESKIQHPLLVRTHRSFLVNLESIDALEGNTLFIAEKSIPVSQSHKDDLLNRLKLI